MSNKQLNPSAPEFVPSSFQSDSVMSNWGSSEDCTEDHITEQELAELEATEEWVALQASIEETEEEHLVATALRLAPESKIKEIHKRLNLKPSKLCYKQLRGKTAAGAW